MNEIERILNFYGSDKPVHYYHLVYQKFFQPIRNDVCDVLEIGVGSINDTFPSGMSFQLKNRADYKPGASLRAWRDYFPNANIVGVDVAKDCVVEEERIKTMCFDSTNMEEVHDNLKESTFDIIIDDGLHTSIAQIQTFHNTFSHLRPDGFYAIEDTGCGAPRVDEEFRLELHDTINMHEWWSFKSMLLIRKTYRRLAQRTLTF